MKQIYLYTKRRKKLITKTLTILSIGFVVLMFYVHFDYEKNFWMYHDSEVIKMSKIAAIYVFIGAVIIITELYCPNLKEKWEQYKERKRNHSVQGKWYKSPMNSLFVVLCWIWLVNNAVNALITLWMTSLNDDYDRMLIYNVIVGIVMCLILWGIMKGSGIAFTLFICLEIVNGCVRTESERDVVHILVSLLLCGIMALLLLLKNKDGKNGYDIMFNKERPEQEKVLIDSKISVPKEVTANQENLNSMTDKPHGYSKMGNVNVDKNNVSRYCDNCGKIIDVDSLYCANCGKKLK